MIADHLDVGGSEVVASLIPGAHVIKAFDNMYGRYIEADSVTEAGRRILFYAGDHEDSKTLFRAVVERLGTRPSIWAPFKWVV